MLHQQNVHVACTATAPLLGHAYGHNTCQQNMEHRFELNFSGSDALSSFCCCTSFLQAWLNRALQQLASSCTAAGIPESAVAAKLRTRGVDLQQLQARAAEVANGIGECASDEGWKLIQDDGKLRLLYRHAAGSTVHCFKGSCLLPAPMNVSSSRSGSGARAVGWTFNIQLLLSKSMQQQQQQLYRHAAGSTVHCFKGSCLLPAPMNVSSSRRGQECQACRTDDKLLLSSCYSPTPCSRSSRILQHQQHHKQMQEGCGCLQDSACRMERSVSSSYYPMPCSSSSHSSATSMWGSGVSYESLA
jgi:hypothetical protein